MENIFAFIFACAMLAIIPGPDILFVITQGITRGKKSAIFTAAGLATGCIFHVTCAALGVSIIFKQSRIAFLILQLFGAGYLLYLAFRAFKSTKKLSANLNAAVSGYKKGILMNILNPKVALFFIAFLPKFVSKNTKHFALDMIFLGLIFIIVSFLVFCLCAILSSKFNKFIVENENFSNYANKFSGCVFIIIALFLLFAP